MDLFLFKNLFGSWEFWKENIYLKDYVDIFLTSFLIYCFIFLLAKTRSLRAMIGVGLILFIYGLAYAFNFSLTSRIMQTVIGALMVILAVVFQAELRRFFWLVGAFSIKSDKLILPQRNLQTMADIVWELADRRIGALVIFPGLESIEPYVTEGVDIDAKISKKLMLNIFNTATPTHDGAIIIYNNRIKRVGVYLPLSKDKEQLKNYGARHRAALGLAEKTDALCLVVSEEKGAVAIAREGKLQTMADQDSLIAILEEFIRHHSGQVAESPWKHFWRSLKSNLAIGLLSLMVAVSLWAVLSYPNLGIVQRSFIVPVQFVNVPENLIADNIKPQEIVVTFSGRSQDFQLLEPQALNVSVDLREIKSAGNQRIVLSASNVKFPPSLSLDQLEPREVRFKLSRK